MPAVRYVSAESVKLQREEGAVHLRVHLDDLCVLNAKLQSAFPLSAAGNLTSILDGSGSEVAIVRNPLQLDPASRRLFEEELDRRYYTPRLQKLTLVRMEAGMWHFIADSQRGEVDFFVRNWRDSAQEIAPGRWQVNSVDGARYEIPNLEGLDSSSRKLMDQLL